MTRNRLGLITRILVTTTTLWIGACVGTPAGEMKSLGPLEFEVKPPVKLLGRVLRIDVVPNGGNIRVPVDEETKELRWWSHKPFWIQFEGLDAVGKKGGNDFGGPKDWKKADKDPDSKLYVFMLPISGAALPAGTHTAKYFIRHQKDDVYVLDPVVIVDR